MSPVQWLQENLFQIIFLFCISIVCNCNGSPEEEENTAAKSLEVVVVIHLRHWIIFYVPKDLKNVKK